MNIENPRVGGSVLCMGAQASRRELGKWAKRGSSPGVRRSLMAGSGFRPFRQI